MSYLFEWQCGRAGPPHVLLELGLALIVICGVAFLVYFQLMLLRELNHRNLPMSLLKRHHRTKPPRMLHIHELETIYGKTKFNASSHVLEADRLQLLLFLQSSRAGGFVWRAK